MINKPTDMNKSSLRQEYIMKRKLLGTADFDEKNALVSEGVMNYLTNKGFQVIHTFLPQQNSREADTWQIIDMIRLDLPSTLIASPYIIPGTREMEHYLISKETQLAYNQWKIPEPDPGAAQKIYPEQIDAIFVPLLAFDLEGYRVGYGGGYYDRFLKNCRPDAVKIGLSFFDPVEKIKDRDQYDVPLDICITPAKTYDFQQKGRSPDI
jgi:5-formyltetrahydrofolate cyclo-ligase